MQKIVLATVVIAALAVSNPSLAQDKKTRDKEVKEKSARTKSDYEVKDDFKAKEDFDQIIIRKKTDKDTKVIVEIKGGEVIVNGKPLEDFENEDVSVRRSKTPRVYNADTRFRSLAPLTTIGRAWSVEEDGDAPAMVYSSNRAFLGVSTEEEDGGAKITGITEKSAAEKAGLKKGDVIKKINDIKIEDPADLSNAVGKFKPEDKVSITYNREGKENKTEATLGKSRSINSQAYSFSAPRAYASPDPFEFRYDGNFYNVTGRPRLGIKAQDTEEGKGVKVLEVTKESLAEKAGIKEGDIITEFDGKVVNSADDLAEAAGDARDEQKTAMKVQVTRDGKPQTIEIKVPKKLKTANL